MPQSEWPYWIAFYRLEPFGGDVQDTQLAQLCAVLANVNRNPKQKPQPFKVTDFKLAAAMRRPAKKNVGQMFKALAAMLKKPEQ